MLKEYSHKVQYYETDKMGITHHSNYVRWMEEARIYFLDKILNDLIISLKKLI
jgi:acyl-CoA thioester hydrolase